MTPAFAVWLTGLPSSGKSTIARELVRMLRTRGIDAALLESDALREVLTPHPTYSDEERDAFYGALAYIGSLLVNHGVPVIFDATAHRRRYRDAARRSVERFLEVYVECPIEICVARDVKGIYRRARSGLAATVPGLQASYEPPPNPDVVVSGSAGAPSDAAAVIVSALDAKGCLAARLEC
jgi:adenylylsulfate kinase